MNLKDYDALWRAFYRELQASGLQAKIFAAGISDVLLATYCGIYAKESLTREPRAEFETEITTAIHNAALSQGAEMRTIAEALHKALHSHFYPEG